VTEVLSCLNGIHPRSEALVAATRDYDRKRISLQELEQQFHGDLENLIALQLETKLDYLSDGMLRWQDLFRPFVESCEGLEAGPLTRFFDNNTFYRQPVVKGGLKHKAPAAHYYNAEALPKNAKWKAVLPSPYAFSRMAENRFYKHQNELMLEFAAQILKPEIERLVKMGFSFIQLNEPYLAYHRDYAAEDLKRFKEAISLLARGLKAKLCLHTYFGDAGPFIEKLLEFEMDAIGVDFFETDLESIPTRFSEKELLCGCVDARSSLIENPDSVLRFTDKVCEKLNPKAIYITTNTDLDFLPERIAQSKVRLIGSLAQKLRKGGL